MKRNFLQTGTVSAYISVSGDCPRFNPRVRKCQCARPAVAYEEQEMRVFVTGATGFIGTELVQELIEAGHHVRGLTRSDAGAEQLRTVGAEIHRGNLQDLDSLRSGAIGMDVVVNLAFSH